MPALVAPAAAPPPRPASLGVAITVTQKSAPDVLGIPGRRFLALVRAWQIPHAPFGRLVIARVDDVLSALAAHTSAANETDLDAAVAAELRARAARRGKSTRGARA